MEEYGKITEAVHTRALEEVQALAGSIVVHKGHLSREDQVGALLAEMLQLAKVYEDVMVSRAGNHEKRQAFADVADVLKIVGDVPGEIFESAKDVVAAVECALEEKLRQAEKEAAISAISPEGLQVQAMPQERKKHYGPN